MLFFVFFLQTELVLNSSVLLPLSRIANLQIKPNRNLGKYQNFSFDIKRSWEPRQSIFWFWNFPVMLGYDEPPISIQTIYDYEVELPHRIPELYGKQASFVLPAPSHLSPSAAPEDWSCHGSPGCLGIVDWHLTLSISVKNCSCNILPVRIWCRGEEIFFLFLQ